MVYFDPVLDYQLNIDGEVLGLGINANAGELARNYSGDTHNHSRFELHIILEGRFQMDVEGVSHLLRAGQAIVIAPGQFHRSGDLTENCRRLTVGMTPQKGSLSRRMATAVAEQNVFDLPDNMLQLCDSILQESDGKNAFCLELMRVQMVELVIRFLRLIHLQDEYNLPETSHERPQDVIDNYFEVNLGQNPSADELAHRLHISRRHLNRMLQSIYGMGFREKLLRARMDKAKWLLRHTDKSVSVIAGEVGYTYDSAFRQAFHQQYDMTPQAYRLQQKRTKERIDTP